MEQQRFASLMGRARQWLSPDEFEPEREAPPPSGKRQVETQSPRSLPAAISSITLGMPDQPAAISPARTPFTIGAPPR